MGAPSWPSSLRSLAAAAVCVLATGAVADDILKTSGFMNCASDGIIKVSKIDIAYNNDNKTITFDLAGSSSKQQKVEAYLEVTAYGNSIYQNSFNPCDDATFVERLCPVPAGDFSAFGKQEIPSSFADLVPSIAFQVPDISAQATMKLKALDTDEDIACVQSHVTNGKTTDVAAVSYVAAGVMGASLIVSGMSAVGSAVTGGGGSLSAGSVGTVSPSPGFTEMVGWFQGMAMNGMLSVSYPPVYRSFTKNFAFSTGLVPWDPVLTAIDRFRASTGGNLTTDSVAFLKNATLVFPDGSTDDLADQSTRRVKRAFDHFSFLAERALGFETDDSSGGGGGGIQSTVSGLKAYANQLRVPGSDVFMTALLIVAIVIAAIVVFLLLFKVILELWAMYGNLPQSMSGFRRHYWGSIARTITTLILLLYGIWVLYCVFQFTLGDSWAAVTLAAVTLAIFTGILAFFSWKIWSVARALRNKEGDTSALFEEKKLWVKYSLFYDAYRKQYWWLFVPAIVYMAVKGCVLAAGDGAGRGQTIALFVVEAVMLGLLLWSRPYERRSGNVVNITIQVVRFLSVACILVFVEEFGVQQTTKTITGVVLIAVQSTLTVILVILIAWHALEACFSKNPHRQRRKEMEKRRFADADDLTPLDARNSLLLERFPTNKSKMSNDSESISSLNKAPVRPASREYYMAAQEPYDYRRTNTPTPVAPSGGPLFRTMTPTTDNDLRPGVGPGVQQQQQQQYRGVGYSGY
ncbi:Transient receptor potential (TRP) ion channel [Geosmithia morbida]|uniref:Transient receptor potential (TRP) ion channel n=1 Tax=Geosmithia morbida TaxID=1094350 RepID=A0A9P4YVL7_9HYPO|nr:Transient receptor potential (TRP) ion channel [Geosmithia morbida]KAF4123921.1 Transient receptor potential (TRP) ion channel [Geosmithia morbida]